MATYVRDKSQEQQLKKLAAIYKGTLYADRPPPGKTEDERGNKIPFRKRQPQVQRRLPKRLVRAVANLLFGGNRFPTFTHDDATVQKAAGAVVEMLLLASRAVKQARLALRDGAIAITFAVVDGEPAIRTWSAAEVGRVEWDERRPDRITLIRILKQFSQQEKDATGKVITRRYWFRRDYTPEAEIEYEPVPVDEARDPESPDVRWVPKEDNPAPHGFGFVFGEWIPILTEEDDDRRGESLLENLDSLLEAVDYNLSHLDRVLEYHAEPWVARSGDGGMSGALPELDPDTGEPLPGRLAVGKGDGDILDLGVDGTIKFVEMQGTIQNIQQKHLEELERMIRTDTHVVEVSAETAVTADSRPALERIYAPMIDLCDELRTEIGERGLARLVAKLLVALARYQRGGQEVVLPEGVSLERIPDDPRRLQLGLDWGSYFEPTAVDRQNEATAVSTAVVAGMPRHLAMRYLLPLFGVSGTELDTVIKAIEAEEQESRTAARQERAEDRDIDEALRGERLAA